jgi:nitrogen fixation protein NifX
MLAAFATTDLATVDAHFGWTPNLVVYEVTPEGSRWVARHAFEHATADGTHDKLPPRLDALAGCTVLFSAAIGAGAAAKVAALGVHAARPQDTDRIPELLEKLSRLLAGTPPPWLRRALQRKEEET